MFYTHTAVVLAHDPANIPVVTHHTYNRRLDVALEICGVDFQLTPEQLNTLADLVNAAAQDVSRLMDEVRIMT